MRVPRYSDERKAAGFDNFDEAAVLTQEPVARMDRVGVGDLRSSNDPIRVEVTLACDGFADADRLIGQFDVARIPIGLGVDRDGFDTEGLAGTNDPQGNLSSIGDQDPTEHA